jgi:Cu2+-exporting ATPase
MLADRLAGYFIAARLLIAAAVATYWWFHEPQRALWITLSVLVVTCPCALSLATPTALTVASNILRQRGFLISRIHVLDTLATVDQVVFDKTGTLTEGDLRLAVIEIQGTDPDLSEQQIAAWAAALERGSQHPIARALQRDSRLENITTIDVTEQRFVTGSGVRGQIGSEVFYLGSPVWIRQMTGLNKPFPVLPGQPSGQYMEVALVRSDRWLATLYFADQLRPTAVSAVNQLRQLGLELSLLSGDPSTSAACIVKPLDFNQAQFAMQPEQKLAAVQDLQRRGKRVLMIGDGINDVPVLQAADVSVALGQASDLSQIHADVTLLSGDLRALPEAIATATRTRRIIKQNIVWAIVYNLIALPLAAAGYVPPWAAAIGMSGSSLLVMLNALRLARGAGRSRELLMPSL